MHDIRITFRVSAALAIALLTVSLPLGCTPPGWQPAAPPAPPADLMQGEWEGSWSSDSMGTGGWMRAAIEKTADGDYLASFTSQTPMGEDKSTCLFRVEKVPGSWGFEGKEDLGFLKGGVYKYGGTTDGTNFTCKYDSSFERGTFRMTRKKAATSGTAAP